MRHYFWRLMLIGFSWLPKINISLLNQYLWKNVCVVVQFYPWFKFCFLLFQTHYHHITITKTKEIKIWTKDKIEPQHMQTTLPNKGGSNTFLFIPSVKSASISPPTSCLQNILPLLHSKLTTSKQHWRGARKDCMKSRKCNDLSFILVGV